MKRFFCLILALSLLAALCACQPEQPVPTDPTDAPPTSESGTPGDSSLTDSGQPTAEPTEEPTEEPTGEPSSEPSQPYTVTYSAAQPFSDGQGGVLCQSIVAVKNTGDCPLSLGYGSANLSYGDAAILIDGFAAYPQVIAPGETGYYYDCSSVDLPENMTLTLDFSPDIRETSQNPVRYESTGYSYLRDSVYGGMSLKGYINYTGNSDAWGLYIVCVLFDRNDLPVGLMYSIVDTPESGTALPFELSNFELPPTLKAGQIGSYEVFAYPTAK